MAAPLRFIPEETKLWTDPKGRPIAIAEVTIRTSQGRYLMKPTPENTDLLLGVIGRAQAVLDFELYGYAYLSNHGSMLVGVRSAQHLSRVMNYIHGNIAKELSRKENSDWSGQFIGRRGRPILVLGDEELEGRLRYILANSTKEHLVARPERWPGAHCARALCRGTTDKGTWINRTELGKMGPVGRKQRPPRESDASTIYPVKLEKLPCRQDLTNTQYQEWVRHLCREISEEAAEERKQTGQSLLGAGRLMRIQPHHRPSTLARSPAPPVHCYDRERRRWFLQAYELFVDAYRAAFQALHKGLKDFCFPEGGLPPTWTCDCVSS